MNKEKLSQLFTSFIAKNQLPRAIVTIQSGDKEENLQLQHGEIDSQSPFLLASVTKLWTTTLIFQLIDQRKLSYNDIVTDFIEKEKVLGLHHISGQDQTAFITVKDLLFQRSGLPNVFYEEPVALRKRIAQEDFAYDLEEMLAWVKKIDAHFVPGSDQAYYADINFILLGLIIEKIYRQSFDDCVDRYIMEPLKLNHSFVPGSEFALIPPLYTGKSYLQRPKLIASGQAAGGGVSTAADLMVFIRAFIEGKLFNSVHWQEMKDYRPLQGDYAPVEYGGGHMKIAMGQFEESERLSFIGHSGISGAFAFYCPQLDIYLTGTTDNAGKSELCIQLIYLLLFELEKEYKQRN
ncbi:beta-lactamase family protein [Streptococcus didelphis]|uniref:Beta-lactamase family protein n=1 Tax=Streptococcus didelphis TaxID=102886 RepID=A0ABY9LGJ8_9STRE|nr:serine hydrolase domain-containing protein [Streptococcus didelphis]WMB27989.1 beta-lactamase family protein [Streptococcus didelphis]WMB29543.1 beta-lactamase family protein [Streptococcus didelphis]